MEEGCQVEEGFPVGGALGVKKITWVRWSDVCKPKSGGGLGVRDLMVLKVYLLGKWRWRLLTGEEALWMKVLVSKYGQTIRSLSHFHQLRIPHSASV